MVGLYRGILDGRGGHATSVWTLQFASFVHDTLVRIGFKLSSRSQYLTSSDSGQMAQRRHKAGHYQK